MNAQTAAAEAGAPPVPPVAEAGKPGSDAQADKPAATPEVTPTAPAQQASIAPKQKSEDVSVDVTNAKVRDVRIEKEVNETKNWFIGTDAVLTTFSAKMAEPISRVLETENARKHCIDPVVTHGLLEILKAERMLVITAPPDSGKGATSLRLAHELRVRDPSLQREVLRVRALEAEVRIDMLRLATDGRKFGERVVLFKDALARGNRDIRTFLTSLDEIRRDRMRRSLRANDAYLILTVDRHSLAELAHPLTTFGVCFELPALAKERLREGLTRNFGDEEWARNLSEQQIDEILTSGRSMPRVIRLVQDYLQRVRERKLSVAEAFHRLDDASLRLQGDLTHDVGAWTFAFVLTLALAVNPADGVPWTEFEQLRKRLGKVVTRRVGHDESAERYDKQRLSEDVVLNQTLSLIERDPITGRDTLKFQDPEDAQRLWLSLLEHNRGLLTDVFPILSRLVEQTDRSLLNLRIRAAQIIGRIGEVDPAVFTVATLRRWAISESSQVRAAPGYLFEGAWASGTRMYRERCLAELDHMSSTVNNSAQNRNVLWSAIAICKRLGLMDLPVAMRKLSEIAERHLSAPIAGLREMDKRLGQIEREFERRENKDASETVAFALANRLIREWSKEIYDQQAPSLFAVEYAIVALCITVNPVQVLTELRRWLVRGEGLRAVTVLIYLQHGGIADEIDEHRVPVTDAEKGTHTEEIRVNPIASALAADPAAVKDFARFLEEVFAGFHEAFPARAVSSLGKSFFGHLCAIVKQTASYEPGLRALEDVFVRLIASPMSQLSMQLLSALSDSMFREPGSALEQFAQRVRKRALTERYSAGAVAPEGLGPKSEPQQSVAY